MLQGEHEVRPRRVLPGRPRLSPWTLCLHRGYFTGGRIKSTHAAVLLLLIPAVCSTQETFPGMFQDSVIGVSDGDTMSVEIG